jgi:hypothetical protein
VVARRCRVTPRVSRCEPPVFARERTPLARPSGARSTRKRGLAERNRHSAAVEWDPALVVVPSPEQDVVERAGWRLALRWPTWLNGRRVLAFVTGAACVGAVWAGLAVASSSNPALSSRQPPPVRVLTGNTFGDTLRGGIKIVGDVTGVKLANGQRTTWLALDVGGLPVGDLIGNMDDVRIGTCGALGQRHQVAALDGTVPEFSDYRTFAGHLRLSFPNLAMPADDPTTWIAVTRISGPHPGELQNTQHLHYYGGIQGSLLDFQQHVFGPDQRPCTRP